MDSYDKITKLAASKRIVSDHLARFTAGEFPDWTEAMEHCVVALAEANNAYTRHYCKMLEDWPGPSIIVTELTGERLDAPSVTLKKTSDLDELVCREFQPDHEHPSVENP